MTIEPLDPMFLTVEDVLELRNEQLQRFGGSAGVGPRRLGIRCGGAYGHLDALASSSAPLSRVNWRDSVRSMTNSSSVARSKVPEVTVIFWVIKIAATTLGETGGDTVSMSMNLGYLVGTAIFASIFLGVVAVQIAIKTFRPFLYWATIIATTTVGTTLADFADRSLGIGYAGGSALLFALLIASLTTWFLVLGSVSVSSVSSPKSEAFYWLTIMFSQTLGTALGDWTADSAGLGYVGGAIVFTALLGLVVLALFLTRISRTLLFWAAFILTRPLGAVVGDFLDKPLSAGGLALSRYSASAALLVFIVGCILLFKQKAAQQSH